MKSKTFLATLMALGAAISLVRGADVLDAETFRVTGKVYQASADPKKPIVSTPLSVKTLLAFFGHPEVKPSEAKFFYDETTVADVLASADGQTIYGTFFAYGSSSVTLPAPGTAMESGAGTMLNGNLQGTYFGGFHDTSKASKGGNAFYGFGMLNGVKTIIKGSFSYSQPTQ